MNRNLAAACVIACGALALPLFVAGTAAADPAPTIPSAFVTGIIDGDSIRVIDATRGDITVHIAGTDSPELNECWGSQSRDFTAAALDRQFVAVVTDPSMPARNDAGEVPAYVVRVDGWNHNVESARAGAARSGAFVSRSTEIRDAEGSARSVSAGLWGANCTPLAPAPSPTPVQPRALAPAPAGVYYQNCDDARARGAAPVLRGEAGYRAGLDRDNDGIGCE